MREEEGGLVGVQQATGRAAEYEFLQAGVAEGPSHQQAGLARRMQQHRAGVAGVGQQPDFSLDAAGRIVGPQPRRGRTAELALGAPGSPLLAFSSSEGQAGRPARLLAAVQATATPPPTFRPGRATSTGRCSSATICWKASASGPRPREGRT